LLHLPPSFSLLNCAVLLHFLLPRFYTNVSNILFSCCILHPPSHSGLLCCLERYIFWTLHVVLFVLLFLLCLCWEVRLEPFSRISFKAWLSRLASSGRDLANGTHSSWDSGTLRIPSRVPVETTRLGSLWRVEDASSCGTLGALSSTVTAFFSWSDNLTRPRLIPACTLAMISTKRSQAPGDFPWLLIRLYCALYGASSLITEISFLVISISFQVSNMLETDWSIMLLLLLSRPAAHAITWFPNSVARTFDKQSFRFSLGNGYNGYWDLGLEKSATVPDCVPWRSELL